MIMHGKLYDAVKYVAMILLPALGTLYFTISQGWGLPYGTEVVGTITAIDTFLGVVLGLSTKAYNNSDEPFDGAVVVTETPDKMGLSLELNDNVTNLKDGQTLTFKVKGP